jgi:hypothetical protein
MQWIDEHTINQLSPFLEGFKKVDNSLYRFRCPICGDSKKDRLKTRGYFYTVDNRDKVRFHCHNCNADLNFWKFLEKCFPHMCANYRMEKFRMKDTARPVRKVSTPPPAQATRIDLDFRKFKSVSTALTALADGHPCLTYVAGRKIPKAVYERLYWCDDISSYGHEKLAGMKEGRLAIPAFHPDGSFQGMTLRDITGTAKTKYYAVKNDPNDDTQMVYGIERLDKTKPCYVVEGPLDSFFFENGVAIGGSSFKKVEHLLDRETSTIIIDNQPRNKAVRSGAEHLQKNGWTVFIWPRGCPYKDINEMIQDGFPHENLLQFVKINSFSGLRLKIEIGEWIKHG